MHYHPGASGASVGNANASKAHLKPRPGGDERYKSPDTLKSVRPKIQRVPPPERLLHRRPGGAGCRACVVFSGPSSSLPAQPSSSPHPPRPARPPPAGRAADRRRPAASFRGLDAVDSRTAWVSGARWSGEAVTGAVYRTTTAGAPGRTSRRPAPRACSSATSRCSTAHRVVLAIGEGERRGSSAPPTTAAPGPRRSATPSRRRSTTASTSTPTAAPAW